MPASLDPRAIEDVTRALVRTRWSAAIYDPEWRLSWLSPELIGLLGGEEEELGFGEHVLAVFQLPCWERVLTPESRMKMLAENLEYILWATPGGADAIAPHLGSRGERELLERASPHEPPPLWSYGVDYLPPEGPPALHVHNVTFPLRSENGESLGYALVYHSGLPASLTAQLLRGDRGMFERMVRLTEPGPHEVAIIFADLEQSGMLSRHVPSARYFTLIRGLTNAMDAAIVQRGGIVGKHAGDGASGFFLAEDLGSPQAAIEVAISAGREIRDRAAEIGADLRRDVADIERVRTNTGIHWAPAAYMGQVATQGRLEVTALGDEVNECARIQESASGGALLVSKNALEQIGPDRAERLGVDLSRITYTTVAELPGADEKARRDAGAIAVTSL